MSLMPNYTIDEYFTMIYTCKQLLVTTIYTQMFRLSLPTILQESFISPFLHFLIFPLFKTYRSVPTYNLVWTKNNQQNIYKFSLSLTENSVLLICTYTLTRGKNWLLITLHSWIISPTLVWAVSNMQCEFESDSFTE